MALFISLLQSGAIADDAIAISARAEKKAVKAMKSILETLETRFHRALDAAFGFELAISVPVVGVASNPKFGDYQSNVSLALAKPLGQSPRAIADQILVHLAMEDLCEPPTIAGPGFINLTLRPTFLANQLRQMQADPRLGIEPLAEPQRVIVDFSSPNIAKEMHVGHLRSTIIGDCIARILEFQGHDVLRLNHVGDWGTQFGMLITYLSEVHPAALTTSDALDLGDLVTFYKKAKQRFDEDEAFQVQSRNAVVKLQQGDPEATQAWQLLCDQSRREFEKIYRDLDIELTERGESFYNPFLADVLTDLDKAGLLETDQGAQCVFLEGFTNKQGDPQPLIVQKSDGGFNYATTDLAALRHRITAESAQRIIYVTDVGQANHFAQVFQVAQRAKWIPEEVQVVHVPFGLVLGKDGKRIKTRMGEAVRLRDLLDEAIIRAKADIEIRLQEDNRTETQAFIANAAEVIGLGAVKYADLSQNRTSNYIFSYDKMLERQGNTAPYMIYAYVRVQGISRQGNVDFSQLGDTSLAIAEPSELVLAKHLLQMQDVIAEVAADLLPNRLCQYLFELSQKFNQFYDQCPVLKAEEPARTSRLVLSDLTARTLKLGLSLLGIKVLERM